MLLSYGFLYLAFIRIGAEADISMEMALHGDYRGKLCHLKFDLVEVLPPPMFEICMREFAG